MEIKITNDIKYIGVDDHDIDLFEGLYEVPGGMAYNSYAILDALKAVDLPAVEVHISNIHQREEFRHHSVTAAGCDGQICGLGHFGYVAAMGYLIEKLSSHEG